MIPTVDELKSAPMQHKPGDVFNPPGLTNFIGTVQADMDITGIYNLNFPPFSCGTGRTAGFYVDNRFFASFGKKVEITWYPHKVVRSATHDGLVYTSDTTLAVGEMGAVIILKVRNETGVQRKASLRFSLGGSVVCQREAWNRVNIPEGIQEKKEVIRALGGVLSQSSESTAFFMQGISSVPEAVDERGVACSLDLMPGESKEISFCAALGEDRKETIELYKALIRKGPQAVAESEENWNRELEAVFTPGNDRYSGNLPELETSDEDIKRLYYNGILGVIYFKRDNPYSIYGRAYDTLMPAYWQTVTFLWDYSLSSLVHSLLDPKVMRRYMTNWMTTDLHNHFGTEYLTGTSVGPWYAVNDYAMIRMAHDYLRWTGDFAWLDESINSQNSDKTILKYLKEYALHWESLVSPQGLADYGGLNNLLECVSTYLNQVASLNAGNVFNMRALAEIIEFHTAEKDPTLFQKADKLIGLIQELYAAGEGYWKARNDKGEMIEVRHCYDFITILNTMADDLSPVQKEEMFRFFRNELQTETWMRALSPQDPDAPFSLRPDHQWNGAYPAWPAQAVTGLYRIGKIDEAFSWLKKLACSANQGPFGQAHFTEDFIGKESGGAPKASYELPYICDWSVSAGGSWVNIVIESIFGVRATIGKGLTADPRFDAFDPHAELKNLCYQGKLFDVTGDGLKEKKRRG